MLQSSVAVDASSFSPMSLSDWSSKVPSLQFRRCRCFVLFDKGLLIIGSDIHANILVRFVLWVAISAASALLSLMFRPVWAKDCSSLVVLWWRPMFHHPCSCPCQTGLLSVPSLQFWRCRHYICPAGQRIPHPRCCNHRWQLMHHHSRQCPCQTGSERHLCSFGVVVVYVSSCLTRDSSSLVMLSLA